MHLECICLSKYANTYQLCGPYTSVMSPSQYHATLIELFQIVRPFNYVKHYHRSTYRLNILYRGAGSYFEVGAGA